VAACRSFIEAQAARSDLSGIEVSFSEIFTDPPAHLDPERRGRIGWYFRVANGRVEVGEGVLEGADVGIVGDYATVLPLARVVHADDPQAAEAAGRDAERAISEGKLRFDGDRARLATLPWTAVLHDTMARQTS
jgi:hypothetical protein